MLSSKNVTSSVVSKTIMPGFNTLKLNSISLVPGYNAGSYKVVLNMESEPMGGDFEGFFIDAESKSGPKYLGQVGRIDLNPWAYQDFTNREGKTTTRDEFILKDLSMLANALGKRSELDAIEAHTIEDYIQQASRVLSGNDYLDMVVAGREWINSSGYSQYNLSIPRVKGGKVAMELAGTNSGKLIEFDEKEHLKRAETSTEAVTDFSPSNSKEDDPFDL